MFKSKVLIFFLFPSIVFNYTIFFFEIKGKSLVNFKEYLARPVPSSVLPHFIFKHIVPQGQGCIQIKINKKVITVVLLIEETGSLFPVSMNFNTLIKLTDIKVLGLNRNIYIKSE